MPNFRAIRFRIGCRGEPTHRLASLAAAKKAKSLEKGSNPASRARALNTRGAFLDRADRSEDAVRALEESMALHPRGGVFSDWLFLALAEHGLAHTDAAREAAVKARATSMGQGRPGQGHGRSGPAGCHSAAPAHVNTRAPTHSTWS
jgi:hypothetical protein